MKIEGFPDRYRRGIKPINFFIMKAKFLKKIFELVGIVLMLLSSFLIIKMITIYANF